VVETLRGLGAPRAEGQPELVELDPVVAEAVELVRPELRAGTGPRLELAIELGSGARVRARRADIRELAVHLLLAALETAPSGARVRLATERHGPAARIVLETPAGLAEAEALAPVRELADAWGGELRLEGTRAVVELFAAAAAPEERAPPPAPAALASRVLIVDDDEDNRQSLAAVLSAQGFEVVQAGGSAEAEAQARARSFEAALVDLVMPDGSGWDVVALLRELQPDARIALVTGAAPVASTPAASGVDVVFAKPVDLEALLGFLGRGHARVAPHGPGSG
jgi:ActR/RegA family two-component response regulator